MADFQNETGPKKYTENKQKIQKIQSPIAKTKCGKNIEILFWRAKNDCNESNSPKSTKYLVNRRHSPAPRPRPTPPKLNQKRPSNQLTMSMKLADESNIFQSKMSHKWPKRTIKNRPTNLVNFCGKTNSYCPNFQSKTKGSIHKNWPIELVIKRINISRFLFFKYQNQPKNDLPNWHHQFYRRKIAEKFTCKTDIKTGIHWRNLQRISGNKMAVKFVTFPLKLSSEDDQLWLVNRWVYA